jgi:DNA-binding transcriptional LysR family regulator
MPEDQVSPFLREGSLTPVLEDWCPPFPGYHFYYPSRRHRSPAFGLFVDAIHYRG